MKRLLLAAMLLGTTLASVAQAQKRDTIHVKLGDTTWVGFSLSDTLHFRPIKGAQSFVATSCGPVNLFKRTYGDVAWKKAQKGDTLVYVADCPTPPVGPPVVPPIVVDTSKKAFVLAFVGPTIPIASEPASIAFYEKNFRAYADTQWRDFGAKYDAGNSISAYERGATYYKQWALTGDTAWFSRAHQLVVAWRDNYLIPAGYATSPHWSQMESLYLDCKVAGDVKSCDAIPRVAGVLSAFPASSYFDLSQGEARIQARVIVALWINEKANGVKNSLLDTAIVRALGVMTADGYAPFQSTCGGSLNYMNGMLYDALTRIHDQRPGPYNAAIEAKALAFGKYLKASQWRGPSDPSFNYVSLLCTGTGSATSAPDLNGLLLPLIGWLGKTTGDASWFALGDAAVSGMSTASVYLYRQFSESYSSSFRYLGYRYGK